MHVQAHISGHISGKIPNHAGSGLSAAQQNGNPMLSQTQSLGGSWNTWKMDPDLPLARKFIQERISHILQRQQISQSYEMQQRLPDVVRRLEEGLFREASSKDEYMNTESLEHRLQTVVRRIPSNSHNQHQQLPHHMSSSSSIGTMIPTPGIAHNGSMNSIIPSSGDNSMVSSTMAPNTVNTGLLAADGFNGVNGGSFGASDGSLANDYQQSPANIPIGSGGSMLSSMSDPRVLTQMIPTPGLSSSHSMPMISDASSEGGFSTVESAMASEQQQMKNYGASQNSRILQSLSGQMGIGMRSNLQQKASSYGFTNGQMNGGLQMAGNNIHLTNRSTASEAYLNVSAYGNSSKFLQKHFDQRHQQQTMQTSPNKMIPLAADMYGIHASDLSASGNLYGSDAYVGSGVNNHNLNPVSLQSKSKPNSGMLAHQPNSQNIQQSAHTKPQVIDQFTKMNFQSHYSTREQLMQSQQQMQKFQQQQIQQPQHAQFAQQKQQNHHDQQQLLKNDILRQSQQVSNVTCQILPEHGMISRNEVLQAQNTDQYHLSELQNHYQLQNTAAEDHFKGAQTLCHSSGPQDFHAESLQTSQQMQQQQMGHHQIVESQDGFNCFSDGPQSEALLEDMWHPQQVDKVQNIQPDLSSNDRHVQEEFHQRITGQDEAQRPHLSVEESGTSWTVAPKGAPVQQASCAVASRPVNLTREQEYRKQQRWLLFLFHARRCSAPEGKCEEVHCITVQKLWIHMKKCNGNQCWYPRCRESNILIGHLRNCKVAKCPVCAPVHHFWSQHKVQCHPPSATRDVPVSANDSWRSVDAGEASTVSTKTGVLITGKPEELQSSVKRLKMDHPSPSHIRKSDNSLMPVAFMNHPHPQEAQPHLQVFKQIEAPISVKYEVMEIKTEHHSAVFGNTSSPAFTDMKKDNLDSVHALTSDTGPTLPSKLPSHANQETVLVEEIDRCKVEVKQETTARPADPVAGTKSGKPMIKGVSLTELFTPEQIREHIKGLRQWVGKSKAKAEKNQAMEHSMSENSCQLCAVEKLAFEPPPIYCTPCGARIKRNATYYTVGTGDTRHYFCIPCYNEVRGDSIEVDRTAIPKGRLEKKRNDEETEEWWVQCDKCEAWQHQICALFNGRRNDGGQAEYTCPNCCITEIERGERKPLPQSAVLGAKDLPRTILSDHIEQRLAKRLKQERQERAKVQGKSIDEVPGAEALVVRVVSSVDKKLEVKQQFLEIFQEENYPAEFPYKSKVILLFQKIEGVEVCLFGMYVQEFGADCQFPNQRRVYLSYLDSVKYFRPEIKTVFGEALRTFVYHEILIGYLEYCKKRGFTSCYIWACPPLKGEDYILYCHPEIQKTPKSDKLREWYLAMLRKAVKENIVVDLTNLYDHFFAQVGECKAKVTAARLPYFDGDYWPGAAEDLISQFRLEEDGRKLQKKGKTKMTISKRALKAAGQGDLSANASKDALLMQKLGETIHPMKEDFIMVHLQHACTHCCHLMVSGKRWVCGRCKNFQLCDKCHEAEQRLEERARHPVTSREKHSLTPVEINGVAADTKDRDEILESEFFDTRQAFLSLCQGNHYQYDTLRRAKHSSMMVLYHLHNPTAPAFVTTCNNCLHDIEAGQGWRCEVCPDFDVCDSCYQKDGAVDHPHKLTNHPSTAERDAQNKEARQKRVLQLRKMLDLLVHASQCRFPHCKYPNCRQVKGLFRHGMQCRTRASGGCLLCKKMWYLLQLHARACKESECLVPRCKDLKEHMRRLQQQSDSRRRAAVMEMMRQRAAEVAGSTG